MARKRSGIGELTGRHTAGQQKSLLELELDHYGAFGFGTNVIPYGAVELNGVYGLSLLRDDQYTSGGGSITHSGSEYDVTVTSSSGDYAVLESARRGRYIPGYEAAAGIGVRLDIPNDTISGDLTAEWGYFDCQDPDSGSINNGAVFGVDSGGTYVRVVREGTETHKTYSTDWNLHRTTTDDTTRDDFPFNALTHAGAIYEIRFVYYGYGLTEFIINDGHPGDLTMRNYTMHSWKSDTVPSFSNPNLKVGALIKNGSGSENGTIHVGGRKFHVLGDFRPQSRVTSHTQISSGTSATLAPIMSFQRQANKEHVTISPEGLSAIASSEDCIISVRINSTLTGANFGAIPGTSASETSLQLDTSASAVDSGTGVKVFETLLPAGVGLSGAVSDAERFITDAPDDATITYCARISNPPGTGTITLTGKIVEEF